MPKTEPILGQAAAPRQAPGSPEVLHYLGYHLDRGGILSVLRSLAETGRFRCVLGVSPGFTQRRSPKLDTMVLPALEAERLGAGTVLRALFVAWRLRTWLKAGSHRLVHTHSRAGLLVACWLRVIGETRFLASVHAYGKRPRFYRLMRGVLGARLRWLGPAMKAYYGEKDPSWTDCLPDCVADSMALGNRLRVKPREPVAFGCVGSLVPVKNWELVLRALAFVPADVPLRVIHAGEEDATAEGAACAERLRLMAAAAPCAGRWEWRQPGGDLAGYYEELDCLIVPSRWEAFSVAALEAVAAGVPVLASSASGTRDLVECCQGGWTFAADSAEALAEKMIALAQGNQLAAWRRDEAGFSRFLATHAAETYLAAYREVLES